MSTHLEDLTVAEAASLFFEKWVDASNVIEDLETQLKGLPPAEATIRLDKVAKYVVEMLRMVDEESDDAVDSNFTRGYMRGVEDSGNYIQRLLEEDINIL